MSHEQEKHLPYIKPVRLFTAIIKNSQERVLFARKAVKEFVVKEFVGVYLLGRMESKVVKTMTPEFPEGFEEIFRKEMEDEDTIPIPVFSHQGHMDAASTAVLSKRLTYLANKVRAGRFPGFRLIVAASIRAGHQGLLLKQVLIQAEKDRLPKYFLHFLDFVRPKDVEEYGMKPNRFSFMRELIKAVENREGIEIFPEKSVEGGRRKTEGRSEDDIKGMQPLDSENLHTIIQTVLKLNKKVLIIPVGSHGAYKIIDSNILKKTNKPANRITPREWIVLSGPKRREIMTVKVGMPIKYDDILKQLADQGKDLTVENVGQYVGELIAQLLPEKARGAYA